MLKFVYFCHKEFVGSLKLMLICYVIFYSFFYILADHPKANEYYSDPRLAAYAVPYAPILSWYFILLNLYQLSWFSSLLKLIWILLNSTDAAKNSLRREVEILKSKPHWSKAYFYLWDEVRYLPFVICPDSWENPCRGMEQSGTSCSYCCGFKYPLFLKLKIQNYSCEFF